MNSLAPKSGGALSVNSGPSHLRFLDGIRALAALYVLVSHLMTVLPEAGLPDWTRKIIAAFFTQGHLSVGVFIVLSGFVLMLPVVRSADGQLRGGLREYFRRRGMRILTPYYAALLLAIPPDLYRQHIHHEAFPWPSLIAHLFLVHDLRADWITGFDFPLWSVAVEWHIYFLFALILLPVWRRFGIAASTLLACMLGTLPFLSLTHHYNFGWACPWFLGLFGLGNLAAYLSFSNKPELIARVGRWPWGVIATVFLAALFIDLQLQYPYEFPVNDILVGCTFASFIMYCIKVLRGTPASSEGQSWSWQRHLIEWLGSPRLTALAGFSYSIYLVHFPLLSTLDTLLKPHIHSDKLLMVIQLVFVLPVCLIAAYLFSLVFERPFMNSRAKPGVARK